MDSYMFEQLFEPDAGGAINPEELKSTKGDIEIAQPGKTFRKLPSQLYAGKYHKIQYILPSRSILIDWVKAGYENQITKKKFTQDDINNPSKLWAGGIVNYADKSIRWYPISSSDLALLKKQGHIKVVNSNNDIKKSREKENRFIILGNLNIVNKIAIALGAHTIKTKMNPNLPNDPINVGKEESVQSDLAMVLYELRGGSGFRASRDHAGYKHAAIFAGLMDIASKSKGAKAAARMKNILEIADIQGTNMIAVTLNDSDKFDKMQKENLNNLNSLIKTFRPSNARYTVIDFNAFASSNGKLKDEYATTEGSLAGILPNNAGISWIMKKIYIVAKKYGAFPKATALKTESVPLSSPKSITQAELKSIINKTSNLDKDGAIRADIVSKVSAAYKAGKKSIIINDPKSGKEITITITKGEGNKVDLKVV